MQHMTEYFENPKTFDPSRFDPENKKYVFVYNKGHSILLSHFNPAHHPKNRPSPFVFFPFGVGHRSCIGRHFAMVSWGQWITQQCVDEYQHGYLTSNWQIEANVVLTRLLQTYKVTLPPSYKLVVEQLGTNQPKGDVPCILQEVFTGSMNWYSLYISIKIMFQFYFASFGFCQGHLFFICWPTIFDLN